MRRALSTGLFALLVAIPAVAFAFAPTLDNNDDRSYEYEVDCVGTTHAEINPNTERTISPYEDCTLRVDGAGSAQLEEGMSCTIEGGTLTCN